MTNARQIADAFYWMLNKPIFNIHLSLRAAGVPHVSYLSPIKAYLDESSVENFEKYRRDVADRIADLFTSQGLRVSKIMVNQTSGLMEIMLSPLMTRHPLFASGSPHYNNSTKILQEIIEAIAYEIHIDSLKEWDDAVWIKTLGLDVGAERLNVFITHGTPLQTMPGIYALHQVKDPDVLASNYGEAFANAIKRVVTIQNSKDLFLNEMVAIPLERFEKLARAQGYDKFFYESDDTLWISRSA